MILLRRLTGLALLPLVALAACTSVRRVEAPATLELDRVIAAVERALTADGFRNVRHERKGSGGVLARTTASRAAAAAYPTGLDVVVAYRQKGERIEVNLELNPGFTIISLSRQFDEVARKLGSQLEREVTLVASESPPPPTRREPTRPVRQPAAPEAVGADRPVRPTAPAPAAFSGTRWVLVVGISDYADGNFGSLRNAVKDAQAMNNLFRTDERMRAPTADTVFLLLDQDATRARILNRLKFITENAQRGDMILVYFACHGRAASRDPDGKFLVPYDADGALLAETSVPTSLLLSRLDTAVAERQLLMLDCCFAGGNGPATRGSVGVDPFRDLVDRSENRTIRRAILTSTTGTEMALDSAPGLSLSPFAHFLSEALRSPPSARLADGKLTVGEIHRMIAPDVYEIAQQTGKSMSPQIYGDADLELWTRQ